MGVGWRGIILVYLLLVLALVFYPNLGVESENVAAVAPVNLLLKVETGEQKGQNSFCSVPVFVQLETNALIFGLERGCIATLFMARPQIPLTAFFPLSAVLFFSRGDLVSDNCEQHKCVYVRKTNKIKKGLVLSRPAASLCGEDEDDETGAGDAVDEGGAFSPSCHLPSFPSPTDFL